MHVFLSVYSNHYSGAVLSSYGREYATDPYLGHSIGPVAGYGVSPKVRTKQVFLSFNNSPFPVLNMRLFCSAQLSVSCEWDT